MTLKLPYSSPKKPFLHSLLRTSQKMQQFRGMAPRVAQPVKTLADAPSILEADGVYRFVYRVLRDVTRGARYFEG